MAIIKSKKLNREAAVRLIEETGQKWPSSFVTRTEVPRFTGGAVNNRTLANRDSEGTGPSGAFKLGNKVCYPVDSLCDWLILRLGA